MSSLVLILFVSHEHAVILICECQVLRDTGYGPLISGHLHRDIKHITASVYFQEESFHNLRGGGQINQISIEFDQILTNSVNKYKLHLGKYQERHFSESNKNNVKQYGGRGYAGDIEV